MQVLLRCQGLLRQVQAGRVQVREALQVRTAQGSRMQVLLRRQGLLRQVQAGRMQVREALQV